MLDTPTTVPAPAPSGNERPWGAGAAIGALFLAFVIYLLSGIPLFQFAGDLYRHNTLVFEIIGYQFLTLGVALSVVVIIIGPHRSRAQFLGFRFPGWTVLARSLATVPLIYLAVVLVYAFFNAVFPQLHIQGNSRELLQAPNQHIGVVEQIIVLLWAAVEAPLTEETLFRAILFTGFRTSLAERLPGRAALALSAVLSGLVFGLAHFEPHTLPILVLLGIALALIFYYARSIYASALVHGVVNAVAVFAVFH